MKSVRRFALFIIILLPAVLMAEHDFFVNKEYAGHNFTRGKLGIVFYPQAPEFATVEAKFSGFRPEESYQSFMESTIRTFFRKNASIPGVEFVRDSFPSKSLPVQIGKKTTYTFPIPETPVSFLQRYGVSFLMIISEYQLSADSYDIQHYSLYEIEEQRHLDERKFKSEQNDRYRDNAFVFAESFWYILIDVIAGKPVQYGFISNESKTMEPTLEDWRQSVVRCYEAIVADGPMAMDKN